MIAILFISMMVFLLIGIPVGFAVLGACLLFLMSADTIPLVIISQRMVDGIGSFTFLAMPLFIFSGNLMAYGSTPRLMRLANLLLNRIPGGFGAAGIGACGFFGCVSGSGVATTAAIGSIVGPEMVARGYGKGYTASILAASGTLGGIIPPSITLVLFAVATNLSIGDMLMCGFIPGFMCVAGFILLNTVICKRRGYGEGQEHARYSGSEKMKIVLDAVPPLIMPIIILGGVLSGIATPTESAVLATVYAAFLAVVVYRELDLKKFFAVAIESSKSIASIMIIIAAAAPFGWIMTSQNITTALASLILGISQVPMVVYLMVVALLIFLGTFMEGNSIVVVLSPILLPIVAGLGMNPYHFGILVAIAICIGACTPPMATCLFTSCKTLGLEVSDTFPDIFLVCGYFILMELVLLFIPQITTCVLGIM